MPEENSVEWHKVKDCYVAMRGEEILAMIDPIDGFPCEAFGFHMLNGVYSSVEAAKVDGLKSIYRLLKKIDAQDEPQENFYVTMLEAALATMKAANAKPGTGAEPAGGKSE
jgi:hypothetical protein